MKTSEVIAAIDNWLKEYDAKKNKSKPEPGSVTTIREYTDALRAMAMEKDTEFVFFSFMSPEIFGAKQYLNKARNDYIVPTPNVDLYIAEHFYGFNRKDTADMFPDTKEMLSMLLVEAKQEVGDEINALITALNQDEWLEKNIQTHEMIRNLRKAGLFTVARNQEWGNLVAPWVWINAIESGLLTPDRISNFRENGKCLSIRYRFFYGCHDGFT